MHRSPWRHFAILSLAAVAFCVTSAALMWHAHDPARVSWTAAWLSAFYNSWQQVGRYVALMAGIAAGTAGVTGTNRRSAVGILCLATAALLLIDVWANPALARANQQAVRTYGQAWPLPDDTIMYSRLDTLGHMRTAIQLLREQPAGLHEKLGASWSQDNPRQLASRVAYEIPQLLLPFITMGLVLGAVAWQRAKLIFRTPKDATVLRWCTTWVLAPAAWAFVLTRSDARYQMLHHQSPYWWPLVTYLPFLVMAALGWRAAWQEPASDAPSD